MSWGDLIVLIKQAPPGSAVGRAVDPDQVTADRFLLREIEHNTRLLVWMRTKDGAKGRNQPKPYPLTADERAKQKRKGLDYDRMTKAEALDFLGWEIDPTTGRAVIKRG